MADLNYSLSSDSFGRSLQAVRPPHGGGKTTSASVGGSSAGAALPTDANSQPARVVRVASDAGCHIRFGAGSQTAVGTDMYFPAGVEVFSLDPAATHFAVIQHASESGDCYVTTVS